MIFTLASMIDIPEGVVVHPLLVETRSVPAYCCLIDKSGFDDGLSWHMIFISFLDMKHTLRQ